MNHDKIINAIRFAYVGVALRSSTEARDAALTLDQLLAALEWIQIDDMPYEFEGVVELAGTAWFRAIAFTCKDLSDNDIRWWHIGDKAYEFDPPSNVTHWRKILPGPNE